MREIKFRAWDSRYKEMEYCDSLYWFEENGIREIGDKDYILMQYTGLKDKNGKEIYEGDIIEITRQCIWEKGIVIFIDGCFFIKANETLLPLYECDVNNFKLKVIGNIYDNPDLLEKGKEE